MSSDQDDAISSWENSDLEEEKEGDDSDLEADEEKAEEENKKQDEPDLDAENEVFSWKGEGGDEGAHEKHLTDSAASRGQILHSMFRLVPHLVPAFTVGVDSAQ